MLTSQPNADAYCWNTFTPSTQHIVGRVGAPSLALSPCICGGFARSAQMLTCASIHVSILPLRQYFLGENQMTDCTHDCSNCSANCGECTSPQDLLAKPHKLSKVNKVVGVISGKGGVGKSLVTSLLAVEMQRKNHRTAILDADITGPSIPQIFGLHENATYDEKGMYPALSSCGTQVMSINLLLENSSDPVVWRGPVIAGAVTQFWTDVVWKNVDFMFVDMPPGTGDVALTVFQSLPVDGIVIVTSPQELVEMIVGKAVKMAQMLNIPILGIVENMSYFQCDGCGKRHNLFGESHVEDFALQNGVETVCKLPLDPTLARLCDNGKIESFQQNLLEKLVSNIEKLNNN